MATKDNVSSDIGESDDEKPEDRKFVMEEMKKALDIGATGASVDAKTLEGRRMNRGFTVAIGRSSDLTEEKDTETKRSFKRAQTLPSMGARRGDYRISEESKKLMEDQQKALAARWRRGSVSVASDTVPDEDLLNCWKEHTTYMHYGKMTEGQVAADERDHTIHGDKTPPPGFDSPVISCQKGSKGFRDVTPNQDNFSITYFKNGWTMVCCLDGHGPFGHLVSTRAVQTIPYFMATQGFFNEKDMEKALVSAFESSHKDLLALSLKDAWDIQASGSTAVAAVWKGNKIYSANVGDSRCVVGYEKTRKMSFETEDHKPNNPDEQKRIEESGGEVRSQTYPDGWTVHRIFVKGQDFPGLCMTRTLGDQSVKDHGVTPTPDVKMTEVNFADQPFMLLASDGVWEFLDSEFVIKAVAKKIQSDGPERTVQKLQREARKRWKAEEGDYCDDFALARWLGKTVGHHFKIMAVRMAALSSAKVVSGRRGAPACCLEENRMPPKNRISAEEAAENRRVELELQLLAEELAAMKKIVRFLYGYLVRSALRKLVMLEDEVLKRPLPGPQACLELQPGGPKEASRPVSCDGSFKSVGSRPGSGASGSRVAASLSSVQGAAAQRHKPASHVASSGASQKSHSPAGSRASSAERERPDRPQRKNKPESSSTSPSKKKDRHLTEIPMSAIAYHLSKTEKYAKEPDRVRAKRAAEMIFKLLGAGTLLKQSHLNRICTHHRLRRQNIASTTVLRLVLVQHGDSQNTASALKGGRELIPSGWSQVTRTAWSLRLCHEWRPRGWVLHAGLPCCKQTAERLCSVCADADEDASCLPGGVPHTSQAGRSQLRVCERLDYPYSQDSMLGFDVLEFVKEVVRVMRQGEQLDPEGIFSHSAPEALTLVATGTLLESLIAFLACGLPRNMLDTVRLGGGDAVLLQSPRIFRLVGPEGKERIRSDSELWEESLKRNRWQVERHIRGDGLGIRPGGATLTLKATVKARTLRLEGLAVLKSMAGHADDDDDAGDGDDRPAGIEARFIPSQTRNEFRKYCGNPLIYSHGEFTKICRRAGTDIPLEKSDTIALKQHIYGYTPAANARSESKKSAAAVSKSSVSPAQRGIA
ncbi:unnamed protein product [Polarella glacialis]|uniref:PPM-type phosphatase domain-containing protein n=1 Tax=Polarella glacialis TaxID=89957 RepID=A0A813DVJ0_POLGL|nr:unnamed protein product [Polarella glacialis]